MLDIDIRILEMPDELAAVEKLQRVIWPGNEIEVVPIHIFRAVIHNGGLVIGALNGNKLVGFVFGFPGLDGNKSRPSLIHASHMAGVHPEFRNAGIGYRLKRAQWQMVRKQGIQRITWTYDPLQSRNANLNVAKLGAVCNTYIPNHYGEMRDHVNLGMPSDRFQVDWWVNSNRVRKRLSVQKHPKLAPERYLQAGIPFANQTTLLKSGLLSPQAILPISNLPVMLLIEIPADIHTIKNLDIDLAILWSKHIKQLFLGLFKIGYLVTDFVYLPGQRPRGYYVLSRGEATL